MNIYTYAMKLEKESELYYRELARQSPYTGLREIFIILANEEEKHYTLFENMMKNNEINMLDLETDMRAISSILEKNKNEINFNSMELQFYEKLILAEDDLEQFYLDKAEEIDDKEKKEVVIRIAKEEAKHKIVLENILKLIQESKTQTESIA